MTTATMMAISVVSKGASSGRRRTIAMEEAMSNGVLSRCANLLVGEDEASEFKRGAAAFELLCSKRVDATHPEDRHTDRVFRDDGGLRYPAACARTDGS